MWGAPLDSHEHSCVIVNVCRQAGTWSPGVGTGMWFVLISISEAFHEIWESPGDGDPQLDPQSPSPRMGYGIRDPVQKKKKMCNSLFEKYQDFQDGNSIALNQVWGLSEH